MESLRASLASAVFGVFVMASLVFAAESETNLSATSDSVKIKTANDIAVLASEIATSLEGQKAGTLADLAVRFRAEQTQYLWITPPLSTFTLRQDCGLMVFDTKAFPEDFTKKLIGEMKYDCPIYTLIIAEDPVTREIVFANADGQEIACMKPEAYYNPFWLLELQYPELYTGLYSAREIKELQSAFDPSRIQITVSLIPSDYLQQYAEAVAAERVKQAALVPSGGGIILMRYEGPPVEDLKWVGIERQTNGMLLTLAYPFDFTNRVDVFTCSDLVSVWWDLAVDSTNVNTSTNWIEWVDTTALSQSLRFYAAGNADLDSDSDGLADAREQFMYHTSTTNSDSDADGLSDSNEVFVAHTDPNNSDTNKPVVWISYPAAGAVEVWEP